MVSTVTQAQTQSTQPLWDYERTQAFLQKTTLKPELQRLADIINDTSGTYSDSDKVSAYTRAFNSFNVTTTEQKGGVSFTTVSANTEQLAQKQKFDDVIKSSDIGKALADGFQVLKSFEASQGINGDSDRFQLFAKFSDLQKKLPQFKDFGTSLAVLFQQQTSSRSRQDIVSLSKEAQLLTGIPYPGT